MLWDAGGGELTVDASMARETFREVVPFKRLVLEVTLLVDGALGHRPTRLLSERGGTWTFTGTRLSGTVLLRVPFPRGPEPAPKVWTLTSFTCFACRASAVRRPGPL